MNVGKAKALVLLELIDQLVPRIAHCGGTPAGEPLARLTQLRYAPRLVVEACLSRYKDEIAEGGRSMSTRKSVGGLGLTICSYLYNEGPNGRRL